jgi:putative transcriptional regulator
MSGSASDTTSLQGALLLASPSLLDPNFSRSVIFMAAHTEQEGAFGYILNRPTTQRVSDLLPDKDLGELGGVDVFIGGPVATDKLAFAALTWDTSLRELHCETHLSVGDAIHALKEGVHVRGFVGYSGWSEGQLENELQHRSWITTPPTQNVLSCNEPGSLWRSILGDMGPLFELMSRMPDDVSLN